MGSHARVVVAGLAGDSGKTLVSLGLLCAWRRGARRVAAFKKGPDYIDAAWLAWASGGVARNLDAHLMGGEAVRRALAWHARDAELTLIEGNRGLFDGLDSAGSASTGRLAALTGSPVLLVVPATKMTATCAAVVEGCRTFDPEVRLGGVILNRVASKRQAEVAVQAIEARTGVPVLGVLPRLGEELLPQRHLGLVPPVERAATAGLEERFAAIAAEHLDLARVEALAASAAPLPIAPPAPAPAPAGRVRVGVLRDAAFSFYYPENLEALERAGATLVIIPALGATGLPPLDLLYVGGGFPETHLAELGANVALRAAVRGAAGEGLPIYAECGGLMFLASSLRAGGRDHPMCGVLPVEVDVCERPQGHGYCEATVDRPNPFFPVGTTLRGHEFHYSRLVAGRERVESAYAVTRGTGCGAGRDGLVRGNVLASYTHLHASATPGWAAGLVRAALAWRAAGSPEERATAPSRQPER